MLQHHCIDELMRHYYRDRYTRQIHTTVLQRKQKIITRSFKTFFSIFFAKLYEASLYCKFKILLLEFREK